MITHRTRLHYLVPAAFVLLAGCGPDGQGQEETVRRPAVAGRFYPGSAAALRAEVKGYVEKVPAQEAGGEILAALAPHAGYVFSAPVAAYTYKALADTAFDTAVIIGHDSHMPGVVALLCPVAAFETPLGKVPVDRDMVDKMLAFNPGIRAVRQAHDRDHTVEVQLPFLQYYGRACKIVPVLFGEPSPANCRILADAITAAAGEKKVFVLASTDMSHYPPYAVANKLDRATLDVLRGLDIEKLYAHLQQQEAALPGLQTALCARGGVGTALLFAKARGANAVRILHYANSGDARGGSKDGVVGYGSALLVKTAPPKSE
ncbi:MAG: AmmeMemoRadiSam system protein B [Kiritimatiellae bacterium]|nr:AmmeMemoRadiSam system protein B [Kiritimatiellia bacterium]